MPAGFAPGGDPGCPSRAAALSAVDAERTRRVEATSGPPRDAFSTCRLPGCSPGRPQRTGGSPGPLKGPTGEPKGGEVARGRPPLAKRPGRSVTLELSWGRRPAEGDGAPGERMRHRVGPGRPASHRPQARGPLPLRRGSTCLSPSLERPPSLRSLSSRSLACQPAYLPGPRGGPTKVPVAGRRPRRWVECPPSGATAAHGRACPPVGPALVPSRRWTGATGNASAGQDTRVLLTSGVTLWFASWRAKGEEGRVFAPRRACDQGSP
jgi:hypothetical protein